MSLEPYFQEYENLEIHEKMLTDRARQEAYGKAIKNNAALFKDKTVLDVGAGTGILSAFCAKAGAKLIYAVEPSNLADIAKIVMIDNEINETQVKVVNCKIEDFQLEEKVDIIVSEWMGFYLLHEGMLDSVLFARDNFLKEGGLMFPSECSIYVAPCSIPLRFENWESVDGVRLTAFARYLRKQTATKPQIMTIHPDNLLHEGLLVHWMNLKEVDSAELEELVFEEVLTTEVSGVHQGFCIWFDCTFPSSSGSDSDIENRIVLSTSPHAQKTHWEQCVLVLPDDHCEFLEEKSPIAFRLSMIRRSDDRRKYNLELILLETNALEHPIPCDCNETKCILTKAHLEKTES